MPVINFATRIVFDHGAIKGLAKEMSRQSMARPLIVTDPGVRGAGVLDQVMAQLGYSETPPVFDQTPSNPTESAVTQAHDTFTEGSCDSILAIGGGSVMDLGKAVAMLEANGGPLEKFDPLNGGSRAIQKMLPVVAVPTTAGTGSEVSVGSVIILEDGRKMTFAAPLLVPAVAVCDPDLTLSMPPLLTAATGMDALTHCIEAVLSPVVNPPADGIGIDALARAWEWLPRAVEEGDNPEARWQMMMASMEAALAFVKGLGAVHAMSHAAGRLPGLSLHHGTLNAVLLPSVLRFNEDVCERQYQRLAVACGLSHGRELADAIAGLNQRMALPSGLADMGLEKTMLDELVEFAEKDLAARTNPKPVSSDEYRKLFLDAW